MSCGICFQRVEEVVEPTTSDIGQHLEISDGSYTLSRDLSTRGLPNKRKVEADHEQDMRMFKRVRLVHTKTDAALQAKIDSLSAIHGNEPLQHLRSAMGESRHQRDRDTMDSVLADTARLFVRNYSLPHL